MKNTSRGCRGAAMSPPHQWNKVIKATRRLSGVVVGVCGGLVTELGRHLQPSENRPAVTDAERMAEAPRGARRQTESVASRPRGQPSV